MLIKLCLNLVHVVSYLQVKGCRFTSVLSSTIDGTATSLKMNKNS